MLKLKGFLGHMKHKFKYNRKYFFLFFTLFLLTGCGSKKELEEYKANMETFYSDISQYDAVINSIDVNSETSVTELLTALDYLAERFTWMSSLPIPKEFEEITTLAAEAGEYMTTAVSMFHQAYESDPFDAAVAQAAKGYYDRANKRAIYILSVLHGENQENIELQE